MNAEPAVIIPSEHDLSNEEKVSLDVAKAFKLRFYKGLSYGDIAKVMNVSKSTVYSALQRYEGLVKSPSEIKAFTENQVHILEGILERLSLELTNNDKLKKASLNNTAYSFDRIFNALRLLKGESTSNIAHAHQLDNNLAEIERKIAELEGRAVAEEDDIDVIDAEIAALEQDLKDQDDEQD